MPVFFRLQFDFEADTLLAKSRCRSSVFETDAHPGMKIRDSTFVLFPVFTLYVVVKQKLASFGIFQPTPFDDPLLLPVAACFDQILKIRVQFQVKKKSCRIPAIVGEIDIFMHSRSYVTRYFQFQRFIGHVSRSVQDFMIIGIMRKTEDVVTEPTVRLDRGQADRIRFATVDPVNQAGENTGLIEEESRFRISLKDAI